ncbi:hypothetical protein FHL15_009881 [Xylaria flabelliformis]|uniref:Uncharacterized protein n=1 Tax=Xylaria flabelliformis TaxID=2512241 RepID=A0A553HMK1_9PEZI|nr:hypothetical protein FHL15_009881 [Xylaria flabelliformis]
MDVSDIGRLAEHGTVAFQSSSDRGSDGVAASAPWSSVLGRNLVRLASSIRVDPPTRAEQGGELSPARGIIYRKWLQEEIYGMMPD